MTVAVTALSEEEMGGIYQRHSRNRSGATVEQLDDEGGRAENDPCHGCGTTFSAC